jgi:hypothetical protein
MHGGYNLKNGFGMFVRVNEISGPQLQGNRTV